MSHCTWLGLTRDSTGAVLYTTYLQALGKFHHPSTFAGRQSSSPRPPPVSSTLAAGGMAGALHSTIITPLEMLQRSFKATYIINHAYKNMWTYGYYKSRELGFRRLYTGWSLSLVKDSLGYALFFATFEFVRSKCYHRFVNNFYGTSASSAPSFPPSSSSIALHASDPQAPKPHYALESTFLMLAGIAASIIQQIVQHPLERIQTQLLNHADASPKKLSTKISGDVSHAAYIRTYRQFLKRSRCRRRGGWKFLYRGFFRNTIRQVPSTSAGLVIFDLVRRRYGIDAEM